MTRHRPSPSLDHRSIQRGVAAIEFALIATLMVTLLLGLLVFWRAFQVQQSLNRAAGDGARHALTLITDVRPPCTGSHTASNRSAIQDLVHKTITQNLTQSGLEPNSFTLSKSTWTCPPTTLPPTRGSGSYSFDVQYALQPLLSSSNSWLAEPTRLQIGDRIVVHFQTF